MTRTYRITIGVAAAVLLVASLGCGIISQAKNVIDTAEVLGDFADRLGKSSELTYTAVYDVAGGAQVTLVQQPPNSAFLGKDGRFIFTPEHMILCGEQQGEMVCQRTPNQSAEIDATSTGYVAGMAGAGFITPELALGLVAAAALVPGAKVDSSNKKIAGQESLCANVTGLDAAADPDAGETLKDFSVCVTEAGILSSFAGTGTTGEHIEISLKQYQTKADPNAFKPPAGATVEDVGQLTP